MTSIKTNFFEENSGLLELQTNSQENCYFKWPFFSNADVKIDIIKVASAFVRNSTWQKAYAEYTSLSEFLPFYQKYLISDKALSQYSKNCLLSFISHLKEEERIETIIDPSKFKQAQEFQEKVINEIISLEHGKCKLLSIKKDSFDQVFFLFSKIRNKTQLDIFGSGPSYVSLFDDSYKNSKKIPFKRTFSDISIKGTIEKSWLQKLFSNSKTTFSSHHIQKTLAQFHEENSSLDVLINKSNRCFKTFLNVLFFIQPLNHEDLKKERHRFYLRIEWIALLNFFNKYKKEPIQNKDLLPFKSLFLSTCQNLLHAYHKKYVTENDFNACSIELSKIHHYFENSFLDLTSKPFSLKTLDMRSYVNCELKDLFIKCSEQSPIVKINRKKESLIPVYRIFNTEDNLEPFISLIMPPLESKEDLIHVINELADNPLSSSLYEVFNHIELPSNEPSIWDTLTKEDSIDIMEKLNLISKSIRKNFLNENNFTYYEFKILKIITLFVYYLSYKHLTFSYEMCRPLAYGFKKIKTHEDIKFYLKDIFSYSQLPKNKVDSSLSKEQHEENNRFIKNQDKYISPYKCIEYYEGLLVKLLTKEEKIPKKYSFLLRISRIRKWSRPLNNNFLLAIFYSYKLDIATSIDTYDFIIEFQRMFPSKVIFGHSYENGKFKPNGISDEEYEMLSQQCINEIKRKRGLHTQEAIIDDIDKVIELSQIDLNKKIKESKNHFPRPYKDELIEFEETTFSREEKKALLLLTRSEYPQTEIIAFIEKNNLLLLHAEVRNFIDNLFFESLLDSIENKTFFFENLPNNLFHLIEKFFDLSQQDFRYIDVLLLLILWYDKLKAIFYNYELYSLKNNINIHKNFIYNTRIYLRHFLSQFNHNKALTPYIHHLLTVELHQLFLSSYLPQEETQQALFNYLMRNQIPGNPMNCDPQIETFINNKYHVLIGQLAEQQYPLNFYLPLLNQITDKEMSWEGSFPIFNNRECTINFKEGKITSLRSKQRSGITIPPHIVVNPLYKKLFENVDISNKKVISEESYDGTIIYRFKDQHKINCTIEENEGIVRFYKIFPENIQPLQAIDPKSLYKEESQSISTIINDLLRERKTPTLPLIFDSPLFVNPEKPYVLYSYSNTNKPLFEIHLQENYRGNLSILKVIDLRSKRKSQEVICGSEFFHPIIENFSCIEHPSQILVWGQGGKIKSIELPRFQMEFKYDEKFLIPKEKSLHKYYVDFTASEKDKQGIAFSLFLRSHDPSLPNKLIVPESSSFKINLKMPLPLSGGVAWIFWFAQMMDVQNESTSLYKNTSAEKAIPYYVIDIRPCTAELVFHHSEKIRGGLEVVRQMLILGRFEESLFFLQRMDLKLNDLTTPNKKEILKFIQKFYSSSDLEIHIKLKFLNFLIDLINNEAAHDSFKKAMKEAYEELTAFANNLSQKSALFLNNNPFKKNNKQLTIEKLEKKIQPNERIKKSSLSKKFTYVENNDSLFISSFELHSFFTNHSKKFQRINFPANNLEAPIYEQESWKNFISGIENYQNQEAFQTEMIADGKEKLEELLTKLIEPKLAELKIKKENALKSVNDLIHHSKDPIELVTIFCKEKNIATYAELMVGLLQNDFRKLEKIIPKNLDHKILKEALIHFFDCEIKFHLALICQEKTKELIYFHGWIDNDAWNEETAHLYRLLTINRRYIPIKNPELLIFEAMKFIIYRSTGQNSHQLEILQEILNNPTGITLAATGVGKTTTISQLWALMKANGKNLITLKVLPTLYQQTLDLMQKDLEGMFKKYIYPFRFDLKMSLEFKEKIYFKDENNEEKITFETISVFKKIYFNLLKTIINKGIVITDYKSFPLLEEKFIKLSRELESMIEENISISPIQSEHWLYLHKILILLQNKQEEMMDEFDQPNRPIHRIQLQIEKPQKPATFLAEESLKIYEFLLKEENLLLKENLQNEISKTTRENCLRNVAHSLVKDVFRNKSKKRYIYNYILGKNEKIFSHIDNWTDQEKDLLAFYKDQFCTYLPLTLSYRGKSKYMISEDGKRIVPCLYGEKHEGAKFGSILEEINYTIQEGIQQGIHPKEFHEWLDQIIKDKESGIQSSEERFQALFPDKSLEYREQYSVNELLNEINQDLNKVWYFLQLRLDKLTISGSVVSMDPQNIVSMSRSVAGISATIGSPDALHSKFKINHKAVQEIKSEMVLRLMKRIIDKDSLLKYDPTDPKKLLNEANHIRPICSFIDGAGGFITFSPKDIATYMKENNSSLKKVGFYDENSVKSCIGEMHTKTEQSGFYFSQAFTRGTDIQLPEDGCAVLTVNNEGSLENLNQQEGRMRRIGQKILLASSKFTQLNSIGKVIQAKIAFEAKLQAEDLFMAKKQELINIVRQEAKKILLSQENFENFILIFKSYKKLFITPAASDYQIAGSYFAQNKHIRKCDRSPLEELISLKANLENQCIDLKIDEGLKKLKKINYLEDILKKMPERVFSHCQIETKIELELEEEMEMEQERELEEEFNFQLEKEKQVSPEIPTYPPRIQTNIIYKVCEKVHPSFNSKIYFTESFLPLTRKDELLKRKPFDSKMFRVGTVRVVLNKELQEIDKVVIGDLLDDTILKEKKSNVKIVVLSDYLEAKKQNSHEEKLLNSNIKRSFIFDLRTNRVTDVQLENFSPAWINYIIECNLFVAMIAQIKFFDGQIEDYLPTEIQALKEWLVSNDFYAMKTFFEKEILKYRNEVRIRYPYSQLWKLFNAK